MDTEVAPSLEGSLRSELARFGAGGWVSACANQYCASAPPPVSSDPVLHHEHTGVARYRYRPHHAHLPLNDAKHDLARLVDAPQVARRLFQEHSQAALQYQ